MNYYHEENYKSFKHWTTFGYGTTNFLIVNIGLQLSIMAGNKIGLAFLVGALSVFYLIDRLMIPRILAIIEE